VRRVVAADERLKDATMPFIAAPKSAQPSSLNKLPTKRGN
jgi:hypothetical protein